MSLTQKTVSQLASDIAASKVSSQQVIDELSAAIKVKDPKIKAYIDFDPTFYLKDSSITSPVNAPLWGVPIAIKDNINVAGQTATCSSKILKGYVAPYDATAIAKLKRAGAILYGRMNMDEFAFGSSCETSCYGPTRNPWDTDRVPGGSSGGSAAAVAADIAFAALGSDTGGSIRQPAALCSVVGIKPTYGRISRYGLIAFASSLDQIGPITKDVRDAALLTQVMAGYDPKDSTSANVPVDDYLSVLGKDIKGLKIGLPKEYYQQGLSAPVSKAMDEAKKTLLSLGAEFVDVSLPHTKYAVSVYYIVAPSEASSNLSRFDGVRFGARSSQSATLLDLYRNSRGEGFGSEAKRRIILGTFSLSSGYYDAYYLRAMRVRTKIKQDFDEVFKKVDVLMTPTSPTTAFRLGEKSADPLTMYLSDIYTISANLAGVPAISLPCGFDLVNGKKLPIGLQFLAKPFDEKTLFRASYAFEQATGFHKERPAL